MKAAAWMMMVAGTVSAGARADVVTDFDSLAAGSRMQGVQGWSGWNGSLGGLVSADVAFDGTNSMKVDSSTMAVQGYSGLTAGHVVVSAQMYIPGGQSQSTYFALVNKPAAASVDWSQISTLLRFDLSGGRVYDDLRGGSTPIATGRWAEIVVDIDLDADTVTHRYDGQLVSSGTWRTAAGSARELAGLAVLSTDPNTVYYDHVQVSALGVPAPASLAGLGVLAACTARRCRRRH